MTRSLAIFIVPLGLFFVVQRAYAQPPAPIAGQGQAVAVRGTEMAGRISFAPTAKPATEKWLPLLHWLCSRKMAPEQILPGSNHWCHADPGAGRQTYRSGIA